MPEQILIYRHVRDVPFCIERAIARLEKAEKSMRGTTTDWATWKPANVSGVKSDVAVALHYLREVRRGL